MKAFATMALALLWLGGCSTLLHTFHPGSFASERQEWLKAHQGEYTPAEAYAIRHQEIIKGMTEAEIRISWGDPCCSLIDSIVHTPDGDIWRYTPLESIPGTYVYFGPDGRVINWTTIGGAVGQPQGGRL